MPDAGTPTFDPQRLHGPGMLPETDAGSPETDLRKGRLPVETRSGIPERVPTLQTGPECRKPPLGVS